MFASIEGLVQQINEIKIFRLSKHFFVEVVPWDERQRVINNDTFFLLSQLTSHPANKEDEQSLKPAATLTDRSFELLAIVSLTRLESRRR